MDKRPRCCKGMMPDTPKPKKSTTPPALPAVDPDELERAVRLAVQTKKPAGGWKRGRKGQGTEPPKPPNG
jgi:hypothetical protein